MKSYRRWSLNTYDFDRTRLPWTTDHVLFSTIDWFYVYGLSRFYGKYLNLDMVRWLGAHNRVVNPQGAPAPMGGYDLPDTGYTLEDFRVSQHKAKLS